MVVLVLGAGAGVSDDDDDAAISCISRSSSPIVAPSSVEFVVVVVVVVEFVNIVVELDVEGVHSMYVKQYRPGPQSSSTSHGVLHES